MTSTSSAIRDGQLQPRSWRFSTRSWSDLSPKLPISGYKPTLSPFKGVK
jgi:hypothetical protein